MRNVCPVCGDYYHSSEDANACFEEHRRPRVCVCGYEAINEGDLEEHALALMQVDETQHKEAK